MRGESNEKKSTYILLWVLSLVCAAGIIFAVCAGAAHTAVSEASLSAARASIGHIEAVLHLAEKTAEENGYGQASTVYENMLVSYDDDASASLSNHERYVLQTMLESFGEQREFDFAITRYAEGDDDKIQIYYFPVRGRTDVQIDEYYVMQDGQVSRKNG